MFEYIFRLIDKAFSRAFKLDGKKERIYADQRDAVPKKDHLLHEMEIIDAKSSPLLTHVSIMLAILVVLLTSLGEHPVKIVLEIELLGFSLAGLFLLRCVDMMGPPFRKPSSIPQTCEAQYREEVLLRRSIYQFVVRMVFLLSIVLILTMIVKSTGIVD